MSETLREQAQFRKGKSPIMAKYADDHAKMLSAIAGRGFLSLPGYAYDIENQLELAAKMGLSELNYKILSETIERELKQSGINYDLAYKNALIQWEIDKQALLALWDQEHAGIKLGMEMEEEGLRRLAIEVNERGTYLIEQKTIIEVTAEGYRTTLATLDGTVSPYELQLANAKLLTAQKKLEIIPILQEIVVKEQSLIEAEESKASAYAALIAAENDVATKEERFLLPQLRELVNASEEYSRELAKQIVIEGQIQDERVSQSEIAKDNAFQQSAIAATDIEIEDAGLSLQDAKKALSDVKNTSERDVATKQIANTQELQDKETETNAAIIATEEEAQAYALDKKRTAVDTENTIKLTSSKTNADGEIDKGSFATTENVKTAKAKAEIDAMANITAKLTHLIG